MSGSDPLQAGAVALLLYLLPALIAVLRRHASAGAIFILNLLLGWTVLGWIVALIWSATGERGGAKPVASAAIALRACPYCAEAILRAALKCKHCGSAVEPPIGDDQPQIGGNGHAIGKNLAGFLRREKN